MTEIVDEIALRWGLRDILARRHVSMRVSEEKIARSRELGRIEDENAELAVTVRGHKALS
jgi:hypothetical protein